MKFLAALTVYLAIAAILGWGILLAVHGNYWLLVIAGLAYLAGFAKFGCLPPTQSR